MVRHTPRCSQRRPRSAPARAGRPGATRAAAGGELDVLHQGWSGKPPTASNTSRRTKMAWSPVAMPLEPRAQVHQRCHHAQHARRPSMRTSKRPQAWTASAGHHFASASSGRRVSACRNNRMARRTPPHPRSSGGRGHARRPARGSRRAGHLHRVVAAAAIDQHDLAAAVTPAGEVDEQRAAWPPCPPSARRWRAKPRALHVRTPPHAHAFSAPPQLDPLPAVQPKQWSATRIDAPARSPASRSRRCSRRGPRLHRRRR